MKKLITYLPFHFLLATIIGICIQFYFKIKFAAFCPVILIISSFLFVSYLFKKKVVFTVLSWLLFILIGVLTTYIANSINYNNYYSNIKNEESSIVIKISKVLKPSNYYRKYQANVVQVDRVKTIGSILLSVVKDSSSIALHENQELLIQSGFKEIKPALNPHEFSYKNYLIKQGIHEQVRLNKDQYCILKNNSFTLKSYLASFRDRIQLTLKKYSFSKDELAVVNALILGQRQETSKELLNNYAKAGAIHILAISGLHIGILLLILSKIFHPLERIKYGSILKTLIIIVMLWMFAIFTGLSASVVRATTMFTFIAIGNSFERKKVIEHSLITSMFLIVLIRPLFIFDVGFQLSYLAVFGIIWLQPLLYNVWKPKYNLIDKFWKLTTVSLAAQIGVLPISLYYFHQFPGLFILSNLVIIPLLGMILLGGIIIIVLALLNMLPDFMVTVYSYCIQLMNAFVHWISLQESFLFTNIAMSFLTMVSLYLLFVSVLQWIIKKTIMRFVYLLIAIVLVQTIHLYEKYQKEIKNEFIIFHQYKKSLIGVRKANSFSVYTSLDTLSFQNNNSLKAYAIGNNISNSTQIKSKQLYQFKENYILVIDSLGIYNITGLQNPTLLLTGNPKINLDRVIKQLKPEKIIVDGTNYKNNINRWKQTCAKQKTAFWSTGQNGVYIIK